MQMSSIPVPAVYREESADFRFFQKWFELALSKVQYDTEEFFDLFDPLRCPEDLLWMLGDMMGYRYDDRMTPAFNRLVLVYFMSMIRLKGSKDGVTLAAQVNLNQFKLQDLALEKPILNTRLEDASVPSNSVYVQPHPDEGYIDVVYFSDRVPTDTCLEYTRPVGMYLVPHAGVRYDAKDQISIDARLTNKEDLNISVGSTHVGHYSQDDYSRMQRLALGDLGDDGNVKDFDTIPRDGRAPYQVLTHLSDYRQPVWYRNSKYEGEPDEYINPGYRALSSLQFANGSTTTRSLMRGAPSFDDISEEDVNVFDTETGNTYTQSDFENWSRRSDPTAYVPTEPMGVMGQAMTIPEVDEPSDSSETAEETSNR